jgi:hypothetical membrane protein
MAAPVALIGGWTLAAALRPDRFDPVTQTISALAGRGEPNRWVMTSALVVVGVSHLGTAVALRPAATGGRLVLALGGLATIGVAALPLPQVVAAVRQAGSAAESDPASAVHAAVAGVAFVALAAWPALAWRRRAPAPVLTARAGAAAAAVLLCLVGWFAVELRHGGTRVGLTERLAAGAQALWPLAVVVALRRRRG